MKPLRLIAVIALILGIGLVGGAYVLRGQIAERLMGRLLVKTLGQDPVAALPDGLHVALCGAGSPFPDAKRAGPCVAVIAGSKLFVVDIGDGATRNLSLMNLPPARIDALFLTHFHSDHIDGLGGLMLQHWGGSAVKTPLPIYGPPGVDQVVSGFQTAYGLDEGYRIKHHGAKVMDPAGFGGEARTIAIDAAHPDITVINTPDLKVRAILVDHGPVEPALGYVFEYKGRKVVISGDTKPSARLEAAAKGADVLVHEALSKELVQLMQDSATKAGRANYAAIFHDIQNYHTTPLEAAAIAKSAGVKVLLLDHIVPTLRIKALEGPFLGQSRQLFKGRLILGEDGDFISLPANDKAIKVSNRLH